MNHFCTVLERLSPLKCNPTPRSSFYVCSVPIRSLMSLAYNTLHDSQDATTKDSALHMAQSVQSMFELYCEVVPSYHKEKLTNLPLLAGVYLRQSFQPIHRHRLKQYDKPSVILQDFIC